MVVVGNPAGSICWVCPLTILIVYVSTPPTCVGVNTGGITSCSVNLGIVLGFKVGPGGGTGFAA